MRAGENIVVPATNHSTHLMASSTPWCFVDSSLVRILGSVQEDLVLAAGETRKVEGELALKRRRHDRVRAIGTSRAATSRGLRNN